MSRQSKFDAIRYVNFKILQVRWCLHVMHGVRIVLSIRLKICISIIFSVFTRPNVRVSEVLRA